jgi:hypothetical protein
MNPIFFKLQNELHLILIPDVHAKTEQLPVTTFTFHIYGCEHVNEGPHTDYLGLITFELPGEQYYYSAESDELSSDQVAEIIQMINLQRT